MPYQLGFIGAGNMAEAIARAAVDSAGIPADQILAADLSQERRDLFASFGVQTTEDGKSVVAEAQTIVMAVKPQALEAVAPLLAGVRDDQVIISIMAGISSAKLEAAVGKPLRVVRVMPNTPMLVGQGMAGVALGANAQPGDDALALKLFAAAGKAVQVREDQIDAITAVSGSGPAYLFYLAEAMEQAAGELGLEAHARELVAQTLLGSAMLLQQSPDTAAELRRKVTSPGGTTEAAIRHMESQDVREHVAAALHAAEQRGKQLGA